MSNLNYRILLCEELANRKRKNPSYSLTAFSRFVGISPATLSQIVAGKRPLSRKAALKIIQKCRFTPERRQEFLDSAFGMQGGSESGNPENARELEADVFTLISDWYHLAILSLGDVRPNRSNPEWIARYLGVSRNEAAAAFARCERLKLVQRDGAGGYRCRLRTKVLTTPSSAHREALRKYHLQNLDIAKRRLADRSAPIELFSSVTMAVDETKLQEARSLIGEFRRKLCGLVESGKQRRVYTLSIQLFPVTSTVESM